MTPLSGHGVLVLVYCNWTDPLRSFVSIQFAKLSSRSPFSINRFFWSPYAYYYLQLDFLNFSLKITLKIYLRVPESYESLTTHYYIKVASE